MTEEEFAELRLLCMAGLIEQAECMQALFPLGSNGLPPEIFGWGKAGEMVDLAAYMVEINHIVTTKNPLLSLRYFVEMHGKVEESWWFQKMRQLIEPGIPLTYQNNQRESKRETEFRRRYRT